VTTESRAETAVAQTPGPSSAATGAGWFGGNPPAWATFGLVALYAVGLLAAIFAPGGTLIERMRALDGGICAQLPTHLFYPGGQSLPLCARNTGIYTGVTSTVLVLWASGRLRTARLPGLGAAILLGLAVLLMAVDGFNSLSLDLHLPHLYEPHNLLRLATGLGTGVGMAAFLVPVANGLIWRDEDERPSFARVSQLGVLVPVLIIAFFTVASQAAWLLYPLAVYSTAGLLMALSLVNLVFVIGLSGRIGRISSYRQLFPVFTCALALTIVELSALSLLKTAALHALGTTL
jgi:uncharacterized membrane protein